MDALAILYQDNPGLKTRRKEYATYSVNFAPLTASAVQSQQDILISADADFVGLGATGVTTAVDNTTFLSNSPFLVFIRDQGTGVNVTDKPAHFMNMLGTAQLPMEWPYAKLFKKNSVVSFMLDNLSATAYNVRITIHGFKLY